MAKVKTFTNELKALHTMKALKNLDDQVNRFLKKKKVKKVISVCDSCTTNGGDTIGIIRVLTYETS